MNITSLQTFIAIVETGSLVRASERMNVTQSTVTARLKTLEDEIGQVLLKRQKSGAKLTPAGTKLLSYARIMSGLWRQAKFETGLPAGLNAVCIFGCDRELWHGHGRRFFDEILSQQADVAISVHQGASQDLETWLHEGVVDVILTYEAVARGNQTIFELPSERLVLYSDRPDSPMIADPDYIFVDHGSDYLRMHSKYYHDAGVARIKFDSSWWALQFILDHRGSAYLPEALARGFVSQERLFEVKDAPVFTRKKSLVVNDSAAQNWDWFQPLVELMKAEEAQALD